jgi:hypothetical protein
MKTKLALGAVAAAVAVFSQGAFAQASSPTRAEVKSEARTGALAPAGQGPVASQPSKASDKTRDERKATTKADAKSGALKPAGEAAGVKEAQPSKASTTDRASRKSDTKAAVKSRSTQPAGESPQPAAEKPMK